MDASGRALEQWVRDHPREIAQAKQRIDQVRSLTFDQALIIYDQCLARAAASLPDDVRPDEVFNRSLAICLPLRAELLSQRPNQWFIDFRSLDDAKRASFPELTRQLRAEKAKRQNGDK